MSVRSHLALRAAVAVALTHPLAAPATAQGRAEPPLAPFAAEKVSVMPVQFLRADSGAPVRTTDWATLRRELDDSIGAAIAGRGVGTKWAYAADIARLARRNTAYVSDPYTIGAGGLRARTLEANQQLPRTLIDNLRSLIALGDSRYALVPVDLSLVRQGGDWKAVLRLVLVDGRRGQLIWFADIAVDTDPAFTGAAAGRIAHRVADLVVAP
jgi:hypothetical protein